MDEAEKAKARETYERLVSEQSLFGIVFGAILGIIVSGSFLIFINAMVIIPVYFLIVPGFIIGFFVKFAGRPFQGKYCIIAAALTAILYLGLAIFLGATPLVIFLAIPNAICAGLIGKRSLTKEERAAVFQKDYGLLNSQ